MTDTLIIHLSQHWAWKVHTNQAHLGHMVLIARRETKGSLADCTRDEWSDLQKEIRSYEKLITELFSPDRFNYTQFGNEWSQLHVHGFPRYQNGATWQGHKYPDPQWGSAPIPEPPSPLDGDELEVFADWLRGELSTRL